jgi:hypothetical protein
LSRYDHGVWGIRSGILRQIGEEDIADQRFLVEKTEIAIGGFADND